MTIGEAAGLAVAFIAAIVNAALFARRVWWLGGRLPAYGLPIASLLLVGACVTAWASRGASLPLLVGTVVGVAVCALVSPEWTIAHTGGPIEVATLRFAIADLDAVLERSPRASRDEIEAALAAIDVTSTLWTRRYVRLLRAVIEADVFGPLPGPDAVERLRRAYMSEEDRINEIWAADRVRRADRRSRSGE